MRLRIAATTLVALIGSLIMPVISPAAATPQGTFTDTVTVRDHNGAPLAGASVAFNYWDPNTWTDQVAEPVLTDSSGVAHIPGEVRIHYWGISVAAPAGDSQNAAKTIFDHIWGQNYAQSFTVHLEQATALVHPLNPDGSDAPAGVSVWYPGTNQQTADSFAVLARTGTVAISLTQALGASDHSQIVVAGPGATAGLGGPKTFTLVGSSSTGSIPAVFNDPDATDPTATDDSGAFLLPLEAPILRGELKAADGGPLTIPSGAHISASVLPAGQDGTPDLTKGWDNMYFRTEVAVASDGSFTAYLPKYQSGKYFVNFTVTDTTEIGSFMGEAFWVDGSGQVSATENGSTSSIEDFVSDQRLPSSGPNLKVAAVHAGGTTPEPITFQIMKPCGDNCMNLVWEGYAQSGLVAANLPSGSYQIGLVPDDKSLPEQWVDITVGQDGVTHLSGSPNQTNGVSQYFFRSPNLVVKVVDPNNPGVSLTSGCMDVFGNGFGNGACQDFSWLGRGSFALDDGQYNLMVRPRMDAYLDLMYTVNVTQGVAEIRDQQNNVVSPDSEGAYNLAGQKANILIPLVDSQNVPLPVPSNRNLQVCFERWNSGSNNWEGYENSCFGNNSGNVAGGKLPAAGRYRAVISLLGDATLAGTVSEAFDFAPANSDSVFAASPLVLPASQIRVTVSYGAQSQLRDAQIEILKDGQHWSWISTGYTGMVGLAFPTAGTYTLKVHAPESVSSAGTSTYVVTVGNDLQPVISGGVANPDGSLDLALASANITGRVVDPSGNPFGGNNGQKFAMVEVQKLDSSGNWQWMNSYTRAATDGTFGLTISDSGTYRLRLSPYGDSSVATSVSQSFTVTDGDEHVLGDLALRAPNFSVKVNVPGGTTPLSNACVTIFNASNGNLYWADGQCTSNNGLAKFNLANGTYRVEVAPNSPGLTSNWFDLVVAGNGVTLAKNSQQISPSVSGEFSVTPALPNLTGSIKDSSGQTISGMGGSAWVVAQVLNQNGNWDWTNFNAQTASNGSFAINITEPGTYRLRIEPRGLPGSAVTTTNQFVVADASTFNSNLGAIQLDAPNVRLSVIDPDTGLILQGSNFQVSRIVNGNRSYVGGTGMDQSAVGLSLQDGTYQIEVNPQKSGLTQKIYTLTIASGVATIPGVTATAGVFALAPALPNIQGRILTAQNAPVGNAGGNVWVNVQKKDAAGNWIWVDGGTSNNFDGTFGLSITQAGTYRLRFNVNNIPGATSAFGTEFTISQASDTRNLGDIHLPAPNFKVTGTTSSGQGPLQFGSINLFKLDTNNNRIWLDGGAASLGTFNLVDDGAYVVEVYPNQAGQTVKRYTFAFTNGTVTTSSGATQNQDGVWQLSAGTPNVTGVAKKSDGSSLSLQNGQWISMNLQKWNSANNNWDWTDNWSNLLPNGSFAISVEQAGRYRLRFEPQNVQGGTVTYSAAFDVSDPSSFSQAFTGGNAVQLAAPNLQIKTETQSGQALTNPNINIFRNNTQGNNWVEGRGGNSPTFSFNLGDGDYTLELNPNEAGLTSKKYQLVVSGGSAAIDGLQAVSGVFTLTPATPNVTGTLVDPAGHPIGSANGLWIGFAVQKLDSNGNWQWQSWSNVNQDGSFGANVVDSGTYRLRFEPHGSNELANSYSNNFTVSGSNVSVPLGQVSLVSANLKVKFANGSQVLNNGWIEVFELVDGNQQWVDSQGTGNGKVALNVTKPGSYKLVVHPNDSNFADKSYSATVAQNGALTITGVTAGQDGYWALGGATPNVTATLVTAAGDALSAHAQWTNVNLQKRNSSGSWDWTSTWANVSQAGEIALSVTEPGTYRLRIEPHNGSGVALTMSESFEVTGPQSSKVFGNLHLAAPNVSFTLKDPAGNPVANAGVNLWAGNWSINTASGDDGKVYLNIDSAAISASNSWTTGTHNIHIVIDPPWGRSDVVRWECDTQTAKPACSQLPAVVAGQDYGQHDIGDVAFAQPNLRVEVKTAANQSVGAGAWVVLWKIVCDQNSNCHREWFAGSNTGENGKAAFNIPDDMLSTKFAVEVNAPWNLRKEFAQTVNDNNGASFTVSELATTVMTLRTPNLRLSVKQSDGTTASKWSGVGIEKVDSSDNFVAWVTGIGTDDQGYLSSKLDDGRYRLNINPGPGATGSATKCIVTVTAGVVSAVPGKCEGSTGDPGTGLTIALSRGNLAGRVTGLNGVALKGAIVVVTNSSNPADTVQTTTDNDGNYGFQLPVGSQWQLKVLYVDPDPQATAYSPSAPLNETIPATGQRIEDIALLQAVA